LFFKKTLYLSLSANDFLISQAKFVIQTAIEAPTFGKFEQNFVLKKTELRTLEDIKNHD